MFKNNSYDHQIIEITNCLNKNSWNFLNERKNESYILYNISSDVFAAVIYINRVIHVLKTRSNHKKYNVYNYYYFNVFIIKLIFFQNLPELQASLFLLEWCSSSLRHRLWGVSRPDQSNPLTSPCNKNWASRLLLQSVKAVEVCWLTSALYQKSPWHV